MKEQKKLGSVKFSEILDDNAITIHSAVGFETLTIELSSLKEKSNLAIKSLNELYNLQIYQKIH